GHFEYYLRECHYSSEELKDIEFIYRFIFNKLEYARYNSTLNNLSILDIRNMGCTMRRYGTKTEKRTNSIPTHNAELYFRNILSYTVEPSVRVYSEKSGSQRHSTMLLTPKSGETIACKVEHSSFSEPKIFKW
ncbi:MHC class II antigen beta chain-like, partial [Scleropages formosus]